MEQANPSTVSQDAQRHEGNQQHHGERAKEIRLDRKDGTGRGHETEKKHGVGKGNWGSLEDSIEAEAAAAVEDEADAGPDAVSPRDFVTNDEVKTLDEYEAEKAQKA